jgi:hypothetical protein
MRVRIQRNPHAIGGRVQDGERPRRALPACLLSEGPVNQAFGLSSDPLAGYLRRHPSAVSEDLLGHAVRLGGLVDGFCLPPDQIGRATLHRLSSLLRRQYDVAVVECSSSDNFLAAALADEADLLLVCLASDTQPWPPALGAAASAILLGREHKCALVINRARAATSSHLLPDFAYRVELPEDVWVERCGADGRPFVLWRDSPVGQMLRDLIPPMVPALFGSPLHAAPPTL